MQIKKTKKSLASNQTHLYFHFSWFFLKRLCFNYRIMGTSTGLKPRNWRSRSQWAFWWHFSGSPKNRVFVALIRNSFIPPSPSRHLPRNQIARGHPLWWQIPVHKRKQTVFCGICVSQRFSWNRHHEKATLLAGWDAFCPHGRRTVSHSNRAPLSRRFRLWFSVPVCPTC